MEKVRLRHHQAEELIAKAKEQNAIRERQVQMLRSKGRIIPPEASLLGCWQTIEKTYLYNVNPRLYVDGELGDYVTTFRFLGPDNYLYGESISTGGCFYAPKSVLAPNGFRVDLETMSFDVTGKIIKDGFVKYREQPTIGRTQTVNNRFMNRPLGKYIELPRLLEADWKDWTMEGKNYSQAGEIEFKAVRVGGG